VGGSCAGLRIQAGEAWNIDPYESVARIALHGRGGYCYHMNGALGLLLSSLGYAVRGHVGGVHGPDGPQADVRGNHLLPLIAARHDQPPFVLNLEQAAERSEWHLTHDPSGGFTGMTWTVPQAHLADFEAQHRWLSTSPESGFVQVPMAERRDATGADVIRGLVLSRIGDGACTDEPVTSREEWFDVLADVFTLRLHTMTDETRERLWTYVLSAHRRWQKSQTSRN
jgi:N-hydroxyarylamine O-acetyltransferase